MAARGMLCWGGPEHGRVVVVDASHYTWVFPIERRLTANSLLRAEPTGLSIQTVTYDVERVRFRDAEWKVLVYPENKERHQDRLCDAMNALAGLCTWEWAL